MKNSARPLLTAAEIRAVESRWFASGHNSFALMRVAAAAVAEEALRMLPAGGRALVLCGPGNNGGDGHVAAAILQTRGIDVARVQLGEVAEGDSARARELAEGVRLATEADWQKADLLIDALFGIGLARPLVGEAQALVEKANHSGRPILSVDVPSGIDADSGEVPGVAIQAHSTVTFHTAKPGHLLLPGRLHCGQLRIADIGLPAPLDSTLWANGFGPWDLPRPVLGVHKYARGGVLVWSGPELQTGAARLAASAALRVGAGAVTLAGDRAALRVHAAHLTAIMLAEADAAGFAELLTNAKIRAACIGPAAGPLAADVAERALRTGTPLVLDADALTAFAGRAERLAELIRAHRRPVVLTPHEGEFQRLYPDLSGSRLQRARAVAAHSGAIMVFKGGDGCIAAPDGRALIAANTVPWLATAGSGDVLAGMIAGALAQGLDGFAACGLASWLHAELGTRLGAGLIAEDLIGRELQRLIAELYQAAPD